MPPFFCYFLKSKFNGKLVELIRPIFHRFYIFMTRRAKASLINLRFFYLKVISSWIILCINVPLLTGLDFYYSVVIWIIAPTFWYFLNSKSTVSFKNRLGLFSTDAIYSRRWGQKLQFLWRRDISLIYCLNLFLV